MKQLIALGALCWTALWHAAAEEFKQSARSVDRFDYVEVTLRLNQPAEGNPFTEAELAAQLIRPDGSRSRVNGFCDSEDGRLFRVRFMPTAAGPHRYELRFKNGARELAHEGGFTAREGRRKGMVQRDPDNPTHFVFAGSGEHYFYNSTTAYWLLGFKNDAVIRECIDRLARLKVNRIRTALSGRTRSGMRWKEPMIASNEEFQFRLEPWPAARPMDIENPGYNTSRFNLDFFRKAERMLAHARSRDLQVSLIFALDVADKGVDPFGKSNMGGEAEQRYYRYCVARFGAFENVWWDLINEWHLCRDEAWVDKMGALVKEWDPYDHLASVHGTGRFPFGKSPWADYVMFQSWDEHGAYDFMLKSRQAQIDAGRPLPIVNEEYGYEDHYPFPWGGKRVWPSRIAETRVRYAWEMSMAGGYQTTGERANIAGMGGWITGRGNDEMTLFEGYARLRKFFEELEWWRLAPHPELAGGESKALPVVENGQSIAPVLLLADPGELHVAYLRAGGIAKLKLPPGNYRVERFNPRAGESQRIASSVQGPEWTSPDVPDTENWVFLLKRLK